MEDRYFVRVKSVKDPVAFLLEERLLTEDVEMKIGMDSGGFLLLLPYLLLVIHESIHKLFWSVGKKTTR